MFVSKIFTLSTARTLYVNKNFLVFATSGNSQNTTAVRNKGNFSNNSKDIDKSSFVSRKISFLAGVKLSYRYLWNETKKSPPTKGFMHKNIDS